ncbi:MAG: DUF503 domain-containing protein [Acidobacteria bacterium]|nr:DUF503 domain-containing protein [Acidobacteriota bacterium]
MPSIGVLTLELHIIDAQSLKDKRHWVTGLKERLRNRHNVAVAEIDFQDVWKRGMVAAVTVSNSRAHCEQMLEAVERTASDFLGPILADAVYEYL